MRAGQVDIVLQLQQISDPSSELGGYKGATWLWLLTDNRRRQVLFLSFPAYGCVPAYGSSIANL